MALSDERVSEGDAPPRQGGEGHLLSLGADFATAESLSAKQILSWELDYVDLPERKAAAKELAKAMDDYRY